MSQPHSVADHPRGPMQVLTPAERRQWHEEVIDRVAYQAWGQAAYYLAARLRDRSARARQLRRNVLDHRAEQDNEESHVLVLDELTAAREEPENWFRFRLLPQLIAFVV